LQSLAGNGIDHALIMLAALYVGIPVAPIAPAYALQTNDYIKLSHAFRVLTPGMVVVEDGTLYREAISIILIPTFPSSLFAIRQGRPIWATLPPCAGMAAAEGRCRSRCSGWPRNHRQVSVHLWLNRHPKGSHQHPRHDLRQLSDEAAGGALSGGRATLMVDWAPWNPRRVATAISALSSTMAVPSISTRASDVSSIRRKFGIVAAGIANDLLQCAKGL
jgi:feruloyl-CoA synthase